MAAESKRARILREVLKYIDNDDWEEHDGFLVFGSEAYDRFVLGPDAVEARSQYDDFLLKLMTEIRNYSGTKEVAKRISLHSPEIKLKDPELRKSFSLLSQSDQKLFAGQIKKIAEEIYHTLPARQTVLIDPSDDIDSKLASDAVSQLERSYRRIMSLDELKSSSDRFDGSEYFEEAHRCDTANLAIASAVLCRAVLEAALVHRIDPDGWIKSQLPQNSSYIQAMLIEAKRLGWIDESRFRSGIEIRDAGNDAIHELSKFQKTYSHRISEIIDSMRTVVDDLCNEI